MSALADVWVGLIVRAGSAPKADDVVAGWGAFWIFVGGCLAVAFLGWSLSRQLRKAQQAKDAGVYGDEPVTRPREDADQG